jgi:hypothetical protein
LTSTLRLEVTLRVHLHESFKEAPLEQIFLIETKPDYET